MMKNKKLLLILAVCLVVLTIVVCCYVIQVKQNELSQDSAPQATEVVSTKFDTGYIVLQFPDEYAGKIEHTRMQEGEVITNVFHLTHKGFRVELFSLIFGDANQGEYAGTLQVEDKKVTVSYSVPKHTADELVHIEVEDYYYRLLDDFNFMVSQIYADERFQAGGSAEVGKDSSVALTYWRVDLPEKMSWEEHHENGNYRVDFYGTVAERKILLYTIYLGNVDADAVLGIYQVDGIKKAVSVKSYDLKMQEGWTEQDMLTAGTLMDTINDVIQVITSSEHFSAQ